MLLLLLTLSFAIHTEFACDSSCGDCWGPDYNQCYTCAKDYIWGDTNECIKLNMRKITGFGRDCVKCGDGNYPTRDYSCAPCDYAAATCNQYQDLTCKKELGFELGADNKCQCLKGILY